MMNVVCVRACVCSMSWHSHLVDKVDDVAKSRSLSRRFCGTRFDQRPDVGRTPGGTDQSNPGADRRRRWDNLSACWRVRPHSCLEYLAVGPGGVGDLDGTGEHFPRENAKRPYIGVRRPRRVSSTDQTLTSATVARNSRNGPRSRARWCHRPLATAFDG